jgi:hypothetical protein
MSTKSLFALFVFFVALSLLGVLWICQSRARAEGEECTRNLDCASNETCNHGVCRRRRG